MSSDSIHEFRAATPQAIIDDLRERLGNVRWPDEISDTNWAYGTDLAYLRSLCESWQTFDWSAVEDRFNLWPQITTEIDGQQVHAIHARSPEPDAMPLVI